MAAERKISTRIELKGDKEFKQRMRGVAQEVKTFGGWMDVTKGILGSAAIQKSLQIVADYFKSAWDASVNFETAMAGVAKTTDLSAVQLAEMGDEIKAMTERIPISTTELAGLVETAGQLGIADKYLLTFSETMAALGVSTNLASSDAAVALAQLANIMQTDGKNYERMGSSIVALGNTSATTESAVVEMSQRLAGAARIIRMSEPQVFGYAAALTSVGIEAEAGGSSLSKLWGEIETFVATGDAKLQGFAKVAGMSSRQFAEAWKNDASGAFQSFIAGLAEGDENGKSAIATLSQLGVTEIRTTRAVLGLATSGDLLARSLETSQTAWDENTALAKEAGTRYGTTASQITMAENAVNNLNIAVGDKFKPLVTDIATLGSESAKALEEAISGQKTLATMIDGVEMSYQKQASGIKSTAGQANALVDRLEELGDVTKLSGSEQQEYLATLQLLKQIMPSAAGTIDLETGAIEGGTAALRDNIAAAQANAEQVAELNAAKNRYDALTVAQENLGQKRALYTMALAEESDANAKVNTLLARQAEIRAEVTKETEALNAEAGDTVYNTEDLLLQNAEYLALNKSIEAAGDVAYAASGKTAKLNADITAEAAALEAAGPYAEDYAAKLAAMGETLEGVSGADGSLTTAAQRQIDDFQAMSDRLNELQQEYLSAMDTARESLEKTLSGGGPIEMPKPKKMKATIKDLQSQIDFINKYRENLEQAEKLGLSPQLRAQLADGSTESAAILQGIVDDGGKNIDTLNAKLAEVSTGKDALVEAMAEAQTDFTTKSDAIVTATNSMVDNFNQSEEAKTAAAATIQGVIDGMDSKLLVLTQKANQIKDIIDLTNTSTNNTPHQGFAVGLSYVPYDGFGAILHRGEMVLTALEAKAYRAEKFANYGNTPTVSGDAAVTSSRNYNYKNTVSLAGANIVVRDQQDIRALALELNGIQNAQIRALGGTP